MSPSTNLKPLYNLAQQKLDNLKKVNPGRGALYALYGAFGTLKDQTHVDFVGPPPNSLSDIHMAFMKIAVANLDDREDYSDEDLLKTKTRAGYAAILGNSGDFQGELKQLMIIIDKYNNERFDTFHLEAAKSLLNLNRVEDAFVMLNTVRTKVNNGLPLISVFPNRDEDEELKSAISTAYLACFNKGMKEEIKGDNLYLQNIENHAWKQYYLDAESCYKTVQAEGDEDPAVARAITIIKNKLNPQLRWSKNDEGDVKFIPIGSETVFELANIDSSEGLQVGSLP
eukprot:CAMPEP_0119033960 /NCGR_PEP_ID=MMETSP1177-20130426/1028_1 /TAXON_ID=2985 /ORGANISM="Ochromonas sp, Strain CCMP1899" /LENGTH=283 /DNA_ID=CAMNT_0006991109 /DNA_START=381 /DNA_END=1232 /DNA_ORIENTATION=+